MFTVLHRLLQGQQRIERRLDAVIAHLGVLYREEKEEAMATKETLDRLAADIQANTSARQSAENALAGFVKTVADLTAQLQQALQADDEAAIKAAADAIEANNTALLAAVPATAQAVVANTPVATS